MCIRDSVGHCLDGLAYLALGQHALPLAVHGHAQSDAHADAQADASCKGNQMCIRDSYYSQAKDGKNVPVDYTPVKYVHKPSGARPGMVIYTTYQTAYVTPDEALVKRLKVK